MEAMVIEKPKGSGSNINGIVPEILDITRGKEQKRKILKAETNRVPFKRSKRPVTRKKYHSKVEYGPPNTDCQYFTIMSIGNGLKYAAIVKKNMEILCYLPDTGLSKPGLYKFKKPIGGEEFEKYGKLKVYMVRIIEPVGM